MSGNWAFWIKKKSLTKFKNAKITFQNNDLRFNNILNYFSIYCPHSQLDIIFMHPIIYLLGLLFIVNPINSSLVFYSPKLLTWLLSLAGVSSPATLPWPVKPVTSWAFIAPFLSPRAAINLPSALPGGPNVPEMSVRTIQLTRILTLCYSKHSVMQRSRPCRFLSCKLWLCWNKHHPNLHKK